MKDKENAMKFIKELKRKTRKRYNSEEKIAVVLAGFKQEESIAQICRNQVLVSEINFVLEISPDKYSSITN